MSLHLKNILEKSQDIFNNNKKLINENKKVKDDKSIMQTTGLKRNTIDKFYTIINIVNKCIELIKENIDIKENDLCIEPSAGNGSFITAIKSLFRNYIFYDIEPENNEIIKQDYLEVDLTTSLKNFNKIHVIGNPPFGRQSSLAIKFIKNHVNIVIQFHLYYLKVLKKKV